MISPLAIVRLADRRSLGREIMAEEAMAVNANAEMVLEAGVWGPQVTGSGGLA